MSGAHRGSSTAETEQMAVVDGGGTGSTGWRRLDGRSVHATALGVAGFCVATGGPTLVAFASANPSLIGTALLWVLAGTIVLFAVVAGGDYVRVSRTWYRVTDEGVELHDGIVVRNRRSVSRDRLRTVDLQADLLLRTVGLVSVRIGTGQSAGSGESTLELRAVSRAEGERLRTELLARAGTPVATAAGTTEIARLDPSWIRYAPMSWMLPTFGLGAVALVFQGAEWTGLGETLVDAALAWARDVGYLSAIAVVLAAVVVVGTVASAGFWIELWWSYRLEREPDGTLRVSRGLLTTRSLSMEPGRLRGVALVEPFGARRVGAARVDVIAVGVAQGSSGSTDSKSDPSTVLPASPRSEAAAVAAAVLQRRSWPVEGPLRSHPAAARRRRVTWGVAAGVVPGAIVAILAAALGSGAGWWVLTLVLLVAGAGGGVAAGRAAYANLGHDLVGRGAHGSGCDVVVRSGLASRRTVVLDADGIVGWSARQSPFQRRRGLMTVVLATAAGSGHYDVRDVDEADGAAFLAAAVPELARPWLARR